MQGQDSSPDQNIPKKRRTSTVWDNFDVGEDKVACKTCAQTFSGKTSTSILRRHQARHTSSGPKDTFNKEESEKYLTQCFLVHNIPPTFLECEHTRRWVASLRKDYMLPGRTTFSYSLLPKELESLKWHMKAKIKKILSFCVTFDGWSSSAMRGYLGLVIHGINDSWDLQSFLLALRRIAKEEKASYIAELALEVINLYIIFIKDKKRGNKKKKKRKQIKNEKELTRKSRYWENGKFPYHWCLVQ